MNCIVPTLVLADDLLAGSLKLSTETEEVSDVDFVEFQTDCRLHPASTLYPNPNKRQRLKVRQ